MKRKIAVINLLLMLITSISLAFDFPDPTNYVSDFENVIPDDIESQINAELSNYENQTSIQIFVVTTGDLNGMKIADWNIELVDKHLKWRAGQKGKDNGIIVTISVKNHKYHTSTGYGIEPDLPDSKAGPLQREILVPAFRDEKYGEGIYQLVMAYKKTLGDYTKAEREQARIKKAEEERAAKARAVALMTTFAISMIVIIIFGLLCLGGWKAIKILQEKRRLQLLRDEIRREKDENLENIKAMRERAEKIKKDSAGYPEFAAFILRGYLSNVRSLLKDAGQAINSANAEMDANVEDAESLIEESSGYLREAEEKFKDAEKLPGEIEKFSKGAPEKVKKAEAMITAVYAEIERETRRGFQLGAIKTDLAEQEVKLANLKEQISSGDGDYLYQQGYRICNEADEIFAAAENAKNEVNLRIETRKYVQDNLKVAADKISGLENKLVPKYGKVLENIRKNNPESNWLDIAQQFGLISGLIMEAGKLINSAERNNSMEVQNFSGARESLEKAMNLAKDIEMSCRDIATRERAIGNSKASFAETCRAAEEDVAIALNKVKQSDVKHSAKKQAEKAEEKLMVAKGAAGRGGLIDWIAVMLALITASELARKAIALADADIQKAASVAATVVAASHKSNYSSINHNSSPSPGPSISISFGGGGGGGFGGGGAGGGW